MNISWFQDHTLRHHESFTDKMPHEYYEKQLGMTFEDLLTAAHGKFLCASNIACVRLSA